MIYITGSEADDSSEIAGPGPLPSSRPSVFVLYSWNQNQDIEDTQPHCTRKYIQNSISSKKEER